MGGGEQEGRSLRLHYFLNMLLFCALEGSLGGHRNRQHYQSMAGSDELLHLLLLNVMLIVVRRGIKDKKLSRVLLEAKVRKLLIGRNLERSTEVQR